MDNSFTERMLQRAQQTRNEFEEHLRSLIRERPPDVDQDLIRLHDEKQREYKELLRQHQREKENLGIGTSRKYVQVVDEDGPRMRRIVEHRDEEVTTVGGRLAEARSKRLANLAATINNWEDESEKKLQLAVPKETRRPVLKPISSPAMNQRLEQFKTSPKKVNWDDKILKSLEFQGFTRCDSEQHLVYDYKTPEKAPAACSRSPVRSPLKQSPQKATIMTFTSPQVSPQKPSPVKCFPTKSPIKASPVKSYPTKSPIKESPVKSYPTKSPVKSQERAKALIDEMRPVRRVETPRMPSPVKSSAVLEMAAKYEKSPERKVKDPVELSIHDRKAIFERDTGTVLLPKAPFGMPVPAKALVSAPVKQEMKPVCEPIKDNVTAAILERQKELELLRNRWSRKKEECLMQGGPKAKMPPPPPLPESPPERHPSPQRQSPPKVAMGSRSPLLQSPTRYETVKKIRVSPPKPGRLYPSVSDIETESEVPESEFGSSHSSYSESDSSFGREIVRRSRTDLKRAATSTPSSPETDQESAVLRDMDDFLDEALGDASPPKRSKDSGSLPSVSFEFEPVKPSLVHSVSTYRKEAPAPLRVSMEVQAEEELSSEIPETVLIAEKIHELECEMIKQTTIISQASQALNLCHARPEFSGSQEEIEAEKLLLLSTSRRMAALHEIERLKVEKTLKPGRNLNNKEKGDVTIEYLSLPIKSGLSHDSVDHIVCLVTSGPTVFATQVQSITKQNLGRSNRLVFSKPIVLENLFSDFTINIEVYKLTTKTSASSTESRKEDKKTLTKLRLTPQKKTPKSHRLRVESPGGPNSVRSPSFQVIGFAVFSLRELRRTSFTLNKVPYGSPLEGSLELKMTTRLKAEVEHRGFLTSFEEVSGFGAWKRKWALLKGSTISFWIYPEHEEAKRVPIDSIDLTEVTTQEVKLVSREVCARPHTFLIEIESGARYLLSADTVDDRVHWCKNINKSLDLIRAWGGSRR